VLKLVNWFRFPASPLASVPILESNRKPLRARVHKVSIVAGGEVSVVVRFGIEEPRARELNQGALLEVDVVPHTSGKLSAAVLNASQDFTKGTPK
jgi:hypothetical protein